MGCRDIRVHRSEILPVEQVGTLSRGSATPGLTHTLLLQTLLTLSPTEPGACLDAGGDEGDLAHPYVLAVAPLAFSHLRWLADVV